MSDSTLTYPVYIGLWTNWSRGAVLGRTLTVTRSNGAFLIAFLAFFVTLAGSQAWRIICFILHHHYSSPRAADGVHHQSQAILRNSDSPVSGFWELSQLLWAWRRQKTRSAWKVLHVLTCAGLMACALVLASGFSSRVALGDEVLVAGDHCGLPDWEISSFIEEFNHLRPMAGRAAERAADYAQRCYSGHGRDSDCRTAVRRSLPVSLNDHAPCPFGDALCLSHDANILLDSGLLDSHSDLGINAPPSSRFQYRQTLHCAPLVTDGYRTEYTDVYNRTFVRYQYGPTSYDDTSGCNCTFVIRSGIGAMVEKSLPEAVVPGYFLSQIWAGFFNGSLEVNSTSLLPIESFNRTDIDLHMIGLAAPRVAFMERSPDLWYRATSPIEVVTAESPESIVNTTLWVAEEPIWPLGCASQQQYCVSTAEHGRLCTPLAGIYDVKDSIDNDFPGDSGGQLKWVFAAVNRAVDITLLLQVLGTKSLTSRYGMGAIDMQTVLEPNQWQLDMAHLFNTSLASMQFQLLSAAAGEELDDEAIQRLIIRPDTPGAKHICINQKIRSPEYTSFNFFGLVFIFALGGTIIVVSLALEPAVAWLQTRWNMQTYARLEWRAHHKLYLQRLAHEEIGHGEWHTGSLDMPLTKPGDTLGVLDLSDRENPRILPPPNMTIKISEEAASHKTDPIHLVEAAQEIQQDDRSSEVHGEDPSAEIHQDGDRQT